MNEREAIIPPGMEAVYEKIHYVPPHVSVTQSTFPGKSGATSTCGSWRALKRRSQVPGSSPGRGAKPFNWLRVSARFGGMRIDQT